MLEDRGFVYNSESHIKSIVCAYQNRTSSWQIIKIENVQNFYWEKAVFPGQTILFNTIKQAKLTIYSNDNVTAILTDTIACFKLQVSSSLSV